MMSKKKRKQYMARLEQIYRERDIEGLFQLENDGDFTFCLNPILWKDYCAVEGDIERMSRAGRTVFLCLLLDERIEDDGISSYFEESSGYYFGKYTQRTAAALREIGAVKAAGLLEQASRYVPREMLTCESPSREQVDQVWQHLDELDAIDHAWICGDNDYSSALIRRYAERHRDEFFARGDSGAPEGTAHGTEKR